MAADLARNGVVDHDLAGPHGLEHVGVTLVQGGEVLLDRIGLTRDSSFLAGQLNGAGELREPRHQSAPAFDPAAAISPRRALSAAT